MLRPRFPGLSPGKTLGFERDVPDGFARVKSFGANARDLLRGAREP